jgi:ribosomal protein S18 acetylase RimI-like enzyme
VSGEAAARIRGARAEDAGRIGEIARAAYRKYAPRIGRAPAPMTADFAAEIAAGRVVVIEADGTVAGYMIAWPQADAYFIDNIAVDPGWQGRGLGRRLMDHGEREARRHALARSSSTPMRR